MDGPKKAGRSVYPESKIRVMFVALSSLACLQ
jgi:hypothetical protein